MLNNAHSVVCLCGLMVVPDDGWDLNNILCSFTLWAITQGWLWCVGSMQFDHVCYVFSGWMRGWAVSGLITWSTNQDIFQQCNISLWLFPCVLTPWLSFCPYSISASCYFRIFCGCFHIYFFHILCCRRWTLPLGQCWTSWPRPPSTCSPTQVTHYDDREWTNSLT